MSITNNLRIAQDSRRSAIRFSAALLVSLLSIVSSSAVQAQCSVPCTLIWADEFDGSTLDLSKWEYQYGDGTGYGIAGWGNNELQYYTDTQATVSGGELTIRAEPVSPAIAGKNYISARIRSIFKHDTAYGRYEVRAKLPANQGASGQGTWPAIWLLNSDPNSYGNWPASGEIDIMEWRGQIANEITGTLHYGNIGSGSANNFGKYYLPAGTTNDFHTYAVEWETNQIRWYVDGNLYKTVNSGNWFTNGSTNPNAPFDTPFHFIMNIAVGGNFVGSPNGNSQFPQDMVVDYVRHYELSSTPVLNGTPAVPTLVFENFEDNNPFDWFTDGGGGIGNGVTGTVPPGGGDHVMNTGWGTGGNPGYIGYFGQVKFGDVSQMTKFSFWINPYQISNTFGGNTIDQDFTLFINIQDDDNNDGIFNPFGLTDDEFQYECRVSPTGPCAITGGGWQKVEIPIEQFVHDVSFINPNSGTGILDTAPGQNGVMHNMTVAVTTNSGADVNFETDNWVFEGVEATANPEVDIPVGGAWLTTLGILFPAIVAWRRRRGAA